MKKTLALLLLLCIALLPAASLAETEPAALTWEEDGAPLAESLGLKGNIFHSGIVHFSFWVPEGMEDHVETLTYDGVHHRHNFVNDKGASLAVDEMYGTLTDAGVTMKTLYENYVSMGFEAEFVRLNNVDAVITVEDNHWIIALMEINGENASMYTITYGPMDAEGAEDVFNVIKASIKMWENWK